MSIGVLCDTTDVAVTAVALRSHHRTVADGSERVKELTLVLTGLKIAVGLVGSIGLFVGAVGVANVLLVSVRERRAEIGVRRAVGATRGAIFAAFLIEAIVMTLSGGLVGIAVAWALTKIALLFPDTGWRPAAHLDGDRVDGAVAAHAGRAGGRRVAGEAGCSRVSVRGAAR